MIADAILFLREKKAKGVSYGFRRKLKDDEDDGEVNRDSRWGFFGGFDGDGSKWVEVTI